LRLAQSASMMSSFSSGLRSRRVLSWFGIGDGGSRISIS
jgi:hypothetical protein